MANMSLGLDAATIVIQIRNRTYTLTGSKQEIQIPGTPNTPKNLRFRYKESYENAIDVGTVGQVLTELHTMLAVPASVGAPIPALDQFLEKWTAIKTDLNGAPILGSAIATVENTDVRIVELELDLTKKTENNKDVVKGKFRLGLMFTPAVANRPKLFNIQVVAFGAVMFIELEVDASSLGFPW